MLANARRVRVAQGKRASARSPFSDDAPILITPGRWRVTIYGSARQDIHRISHLFGDAHGEAEAREILKSLSKCYPRECAFILMGNDDRLRAWISTSFQFALALGADATDLRVLTRVDEARAGLGLHDGDFAEFAADHVTITDRDGMQLVKPWAWRLTPHTHQTERGLACR